MCKIHALETGAETRIEKGSLRHGGDNVAGDAGKCGRSYQLRAGRQQSATVR
jgi:hypothetical protein